MNNTKNKFSILFVDDEEKSLKYFSRYFSKYFTVLTATNTKQAKTILDEKADQIGILLTDQRMPEEKGIVLLEYARENYPHIVRLLTTAYSDLEDAIAAVNNGEILRYITKPWDINSLSMELHHSMQYFQVMHERDMLRREKLNVMQRLMEVNHARDLIALSTSITHLRNPLHAINAFLTQLPVISITQTANIDSLNLWDLIISEIQTVIELSKKVIQETNSNQNGMFETFSISELLTSISVDKAKQSFIIKLDKNLPDIAGNRELIQNLFSLLTSQISLLNEPGNDQHVSAQFDGKYVRIKLNCENASWNKLSILEVPAEILAVFFICYHHNGSISTNYDAGINFEIMLPTDPEKMQLPELKNEWLENIFYRYEVWAQ